MIRSLHFIYVLPILSFSQEYLFKEYNTADGLPSNSCNVLYQDSRGFIWIGSQAGLSQFDGFQFRNITLSDGKLLQPVYSFLESKIEKNTFYVGVENDGIYKVVNNVAQRWCGDTLFDGNIPISLIEDNLGVLWCGIDRGLIRIENKHASLISDELVSDNIKKIIYTHDSVFYFLTRNQGTVCARWNAEKQRLNVLQKFSNVVELFYADKLVIGWEGKDGIVFIDNAKILDQWKILHLNTYPQGILAVGDTTIWAGTVNGVLKITKHESKFAVDYFAENDGLSTTILIPVFVDKEKNIWFKAFSKGIVRVSKKNTIHLPVTISPIISNNSSAVTDEQGRTWIATTEGIVELYSSNSALTYFIHKNVVPTSEGFPNAVVLDNKGNLFVKFWYGSIFGFKVNYKEKQKSTLIPFLQLQGDKKYRNMFIVDTEKNIWFSTENKGITVYICNTSVTTENKKYTMYNSVRVAKEMKNGDIWFGDSRLGVAVYKTSGTEKSQLVHRISTKYYPALKDIRAIVQDSSGRIWVGTKVNGIYIFSEDAKLLDTIHHPVLHQLQALTFSYGKILAATGEGIVSFSNLSSHIKPMLIKQEKISYGCGFIDSLTYWYVSENGFFISKISTTTQNNDTTSVEIVEVIVNGKKITSETLNRFSYDENNITISFAALIFNEEEFVQYKYVLQSSSSIITTTQRTVSFAGLPPGKYSFTVTAETRDKHRTFRTAEFHFEIIPPFWKTWWFTSTVILFVVGGIYFLHKMRLKRLLEIEKLRTKIATDLHDEIGSTLSGISILSEIAKNEIPNSFQKARSIAERIGNNSRAIIDSLSDIVWAINPEYDSLDDVLIRFQEFAVELFEAKNISFTFTFPKNKKVLLSMVERKNIYCILKEAATNIVKHSQCTECTFSIISENGLLQMTIADNGVGFSEQAIQYGNGLKNMKLRSEEMRSEFYFTSVKGSGTDIVVKTNIPM